MVEQNEKKNKTKSSNGYCLKLTAISLLILSPLATHAVDSTQSIRGKEVPVESGSIGLSTGEEESSHLSHIPHESSMLDEAQFQVVESVDTKSSIVLTNDFQDPAAAFSDYDSDPTDFDFNRAHVLCPGFAPNLYCNCSRDKSSGDCVKNQDLCSCAEAVECCDHKSVECDDIYECNCDWHCKLEPDECECEEAKECCAEYLARFPLPNGEGCYSNEDCISNYCTSDWSEMSFHCGAKGCCEEMPLPPTPQPSPVRIGNCFSSETLVTHSERGLVPISEIEVGDYIESDNDGSLSRVYAIKKNHNKEIEFYQLHSKSGTPLEVTDRHMVFLKNRILPIAARDVRVGDVLKSDKPDDDTEVTKIEIIRREGYYNPFTESGTFVLNDGVVASSYDVSSSSSSDYFDTETELIHWHILGHMACAPLRFVCKAVNFGLCSNVQNQNEEGLHKFILFLTALRKLKDWQQVAVVPIVMIMGVLFTILDLVYDQAEVLLEVASSTGVGFGLLTVSLVTALAVPGMLVLRKRYFL